MRANWQNLEEQVRSIARIRWNAQCNQEHIAGVDYDAVVRPSSEEIVIIEITKERNLEKVRADINKIIPTRVKLALDGFICRAFVILAEEPTLSMEEMGRESKIRVCSIREFQRDFFDFEAYTNLRAQRPFGSAVDAQTGENDKNKFIEVRYSVDNNKEHINAKDIARKLINGDQIVLTGDYGTGKSRCIKEVFNDIATDIKSAGGYPIAINLREHWSSSNAAAILAGHLTSVGLSGSIDNAIKLLNSGHLILLLDGFDEVGAQTHELKLEDRAGIRRNALEGVKDLILKSKAGLIISGRSHFFDGDEEMLNCLGLSGKNSTTLIVNAPELFTPSEGQDYLKQLGVVATVPNWLPRKPLVFQMLAALPKTEIAALFEKEFGEFQFWGLFLLAVCRRESAGVKHSIPPSTIRAILLALASKSRYSESFLGRFSPGDLNDAYERSVGSTPDETGRQLLARMCTLGRIEPESPDRQFIDHSMADVLRAEKLVSDIISMADEIGHNQWKQSLSPMGAIYAANMIEAFDLRQLCFSYFGKYGESKNTKRLSEIISLLSIFGTEAMDFKALTVIGGEFPLLRLNGTKISNLSIRESVIELLIISGTDITSINNLQIENCLVSKLSGISSTTGLPEWIKNCDVIEFDRISNAARIKDSPLSAPQKLLLSIIQKIFFQPGGAREESALLKGGYGQKFDPKIVNKILKILINEGAIEKFRGQNGDAYRPIRRHTDRMNKIRAELTLSTDTIWTDASSISD